MVEVTGLEPATLGFRCGSHVRVMEIYTLDALEAIIFLRIQGVFAKCIIALF